MLQATKPAIRDLSIVIELSSLRVHSIARIALANHNSFKRSLLHSFPLVFPAHQPMRKTALVVALAIALTASSGTAQTSSRNRPATPRRPTSHRYTPAPLIPIDTSASTVTHEQWTNVVSMVVALGSLAPKSEYESWANYSQRVSRGTQWFALPVICRSYERIFSYDAEAEVLRVILPTSFGVGYLGGVNVSCLSAPKGSFVGTNAFGVRRTIRVTEIDEYAVRSGRGGYDRVSTTAQFPMRPVDAAAIVPHLIAFIVVHPGGAEGVPIVDHFTDVSEATIDAPTQENYFTTLIGVDQAWLWVMDGLTNRVIFKKDLLGTP